MNRAKFIGFFVLIFFANSVVFAKVSSLHQVLNKYRNSPAVEIKLRKTVAMTLLDPDKPKESFGRLYISNNKMRYQITKPEKHLVVMNEKVIWVENRLGKEFGNKVQVTKIQSKQASLKVKGFLAAFFGNRNIKEDMEFKRVKKDLYSIKFKKKESSPDLNSAFIAFDPKKEVIKYLEYSDDFNKTRHYFVKTKFLDKSKSSNFSYKAPKGAQITIL